MSQNIYDREEFFEGYSQLDRSVRGLDGAAEWESVRALLPPLAGKRVIDLGCGFGWFSAFAAAEGAKSVLGLDLSANMIARAKAENNAAAITYAIADLERLTLPQSAFDFAYSSLALHYVENFASVVSQLHSALASGSLFVFTIEHPIYMAPSSANWTKDENDKRIWPLDGYSVEGARTTNWLAKGVVKQHRTMGTTLNTLIDAGFSIRHVEEWRPDMLQLQKNPGWIEEMDRPMFLIISAQRG